MEFEEDPRLQERIRGFRGFGGSEVAAGVLVGKFHGRREGRKDWWCLTEWADFVVEDLRMRESVGVGRMATLGLMSMLVLVLVHLVAPVLGGFVVEQNSLTVTSPDSLKGVHESAIGNFGVPQYGGTMSGILIYPPVNMKACEAFSTPFFKPKNAGQRPFFALVDRGGKIMSPAVASNLLKLVKSWCFMGSLSQFLPAADLSLTSLAEG